MKLYLYFAIGLYGVRSAIVFDKQFFRILGRIQRSRHDGRGGLQRPSRRTAALKAYAQEQRDEKRLTDAQKEWRFHSIKWNTRQWRHRIRNESMGIFPRRLEHHNAHCLQGSLLKQLSVCLRSLPHPKGHTRKTLGRCQMLSNRSLRYGLGIRQVRSGLQG